MLEAIYISQTKLHSTKTKTKLGQDNKPTNDRNKFNKIRDYGGYYPRREHRGKRDVALLKHCHKGT